MSEETVTILLAVIASLSGTGAWNYYKARLDSRAKEIEMQRKDGNLFRDDLRDRIIKLETKVEECENSREDLLKEMITVRESLAEFKTRVSFLETHKTT